MPSLTIKYSSTNSLPKVEKIKADYFAKVESVFTDDVFQEFDYDCYKKKKKPVEPAFKLSDNISYSFYQRFVVFLPKDSLRRFMFTSKENYKKCVYIRGLPVSTFSINKGYRQLICNRSGDLAFYGNWVRLYQPIYSYLNINILNVGIEEKTVNIPCTYSVLILSTENTEVIERYLHPGVKHLLIRDMNTNNLKSVTNLLNMIKESNIFNVILDSSQMNNEKSNIMKIRREITKIGYNGDLLWDIGADRKNNYFRLRLHKGKIYYQYNVGDYIQQFDLLNKYV